MFSAKFSNASRSKSRQWFRRFNWWQLGSFILVSVLIKVIFEALATGVLNLWEYANTMPVLPFFCTGLLRLLQWLVIPPIIIWFVKCQLSDFRRTTSS